MKKTFSVVGMIVCLAIILLGVLLLTGILTSAPRIAPYPKDSGFASFGADFYEYVNNNAAEAASAVRSAYNLIKMASGLLMISIGAFGFCLFGTMLDKDNNDSVNNVPKFKKKEVDSDERVNSTTSI